MSNIRDLARRHWLRFSQSSFDLDLTLTAPTGETAVVKGKGVNNWITFETDGQNAFGKLVHISFHITALLEANPAYPLYDSDNLIAIEGHRVSFLDSQDLLRDYAVKNFMPDMTVGMIMADCEIYKEP